MPQNFMDGPSYAAMKAKGLTNLSAAHDEGRAAPMPAPECFGIPETPKADRGRYRCLPAAKYSPVHGGYPTPPSNPVEGSEWTEAERDQLKRDIWELPDGANVSDITLSDPVMVSGGRSSLQIAREIIEAGGPRASGYNYGGGNTSLPDIYFDGVRLEASMNRLVQAMSARAWAVTTAVRNLRLAETPTEKRMAEARLKNAIDAATADRDVAIAYQVDQIADTIEAKVPEPKGYVPNIGIHYELRPIRNAIRKLRNYLNTFPG